MPKGDFQMKQELNYPTTDPCYELGEGKGEGMKKDIKQTDKTLEITTEMEMVEITQIENQNKTVITHHIKETINTRKIKIKNVTKTTGMKIDNNMDYE